MSNQTIERLLKSLNDQNFLIEKKQRLLELRAICSRNGLLEYVALIDSVIPKIDLELTKTAYRTLIYQ